MDYTKGEWDWYLKSHDDYTDPDGECAFEIGYTIPTGETYPICDVIAKVETGTAEANAHLIAAAPDMYEALSQLCARLHHHGDIDAIREEGPINDAYMALAKAEGK